MLKMGISKLRAKEDHALQLRKQDVLQMQVQALIGRQPTHQHRIGQAIHQHRIGQATHQHQIGQVTHQHQIGRHPLVHQTGQHLQVHQINLQGQDQCHLPLDQVVLRVVGREAAVEDDRKFIES